VFVKNIWYVAAWSTEVQADTLLDRTIAGQRLVLFRKTDNGIVALENRCCHRAAPLSLGAREGDTIRCGYHGLRYDASGRCVEIPGQALIPPKARVRSFPVFEAQGWIWVWPGDPARADPASIPRPRLLGDPAWRIKTGYLHYDTDYQLINDNLLDLSHIPYVHAATFAGGNTKWADEVPAVRRKENGFEFERWITNQQAGPSTRSLAGEDVRFDMLNVYEFALPGILTIESSFQKAGTGTRQQMSNINFRKNISWQAIIPGAANSTHYFFSIAIPMDYPAAQLDVMFTGMVAGFEEDRRMIGAQQAVLAADSERDIAVIATAHDGPLLQMRATLERLIAQEVQRAG
jgi:phenylpropionate dioxygenase-like ring-hydroxylating dioxygenase large terminal subunit